MSGDTGIGAYASLGEDVNKLKGGTAPETKVGVVSAKSPELTLEMDEDAQIKMLERWQSEWDKSPAKQKWEKHCEKNEKYWLGEQTEQLEMDDKQVVDNLIFESLETYLPLATRRNPEPMVELDATEKKDDGSEDPVKTKYVNKVKNRLADLADKNKLRLKLKKGARHWGIYMLGVAKFGWDLDRDLPIVRIVRGKRIILDPEATIDEDGYTGERIGEYRKMTATKILGIIGETQDETNPDNPQEITKKGNGEAIKAVKDLVKEDLATEIRFIEWWTPQYVCWQLGKKIIYKSKNPHWNYDAENTETQVDDYGAETPIGGTVEGINHFKTPQMPYRFLSVFNLGDQPMDKTSLIGQNIPGQDLLNKRNKQIDKNADDMNGGMVVSLARSGLTQNQAKNVTSALRKGGVVMIPDGAPREAIDRYPAVGLPNDVYNQVVDVRARMREIFGVKGSTPGGSSDEKTVRGKIIQKGFDGDRIGGGVTEYLEQWAGDWYEWFLQLLYVYDDGFQFVGGAVPPKVKISVKEGSLLPKDSVSIANQAMELATLNRIATIDLYKVLEYPNAEEMAANVWLEVNAPQILFKNNQQVQEALMMQQQAAAAQAQESGIAEKEKADTAHNMELEKKIVEGQVKKDVLSQVAPG